MADQHTPKQLGYRWAAEWEPHSATWLSWPHNRDSWPGKFEPVPAVFAQFAKSVAQFEPVHILAEGPAYDQAAGLVGDVDNITLHRVATNDCWIRDHGPWFLEHPERPAALVDWQYNAWGGKYPPFDADNQVPGKIAAELDMVRFEPGLVMEGGSVENNGNGTLLVTAQCLLNPNRNPAMKREQIADALCEYANANTVLWLFSPEDGSIPGDDTDAHIDQLARFTTAGTILASANSDSKTGPDPVPLLDAMHQQLREFKDSQGKPFSIVPLPIPDPVYYDGHQLPASYANFYVGNGFVIAPQFRCSRDTDAMAILQEQFPDRQIIGIDAVDLVWGLGAFHCASMQQGRAVR